MHSDCQEVCTLEQLKALKTISFNYREGDQQGGTEKSAFAVYLDGEVYAYINRCPHVGVELNWQPDQFLSYDDRSIQCSLHGAQFRITDGYCHLGPCTGDALKALKVAIYDEKVIICPSEEEQ